MTVQELIGELMLFPPECEVICNDQGLEFGRTPHLEQHPPDGEFPNGVVEITPGWPT